MQDTPPNTAIATQIKSEVPALYLLAELESFRVMLLCLVLLLQASQLLKLVDSPFRRCGWRDAKHIVTESASRPSSDLVTAEFLALPLPHLLAATSDPGLHRGGPEYRCTKHFWRYPSPDRAAAQPMAQDEASKERSKAKTLINNRCKYSSFPYFWEHIHILTAGLARHCHAPGNGGGNRAHMFGDPRG
ncbi:hypothetical protein B0H14DRAFT_2618643 [Mycena olivaceomarginata]|nr:hypothetical protein B0H14DRAFT_2618643 [Mycena olivaceomarginata]